MLTALFFLFYLLVAMGKNAQYEVAEKKGKTPLSYRFHIYTNKPTDLPEAIIDKFRSGAGQLPGQLSIFDLEEKKEENNEYPQTTQKLQAWGGSQELIQSLISDHGIEKVNYQIRHLERLLKDGNKIKNPFAWFRKALEADYKDTVQDNKQKKLQTKAKVQKKKAVKQASENKLTGIKNKYNQGQIEICDKLIKADSSLLETAVENIKENIVIAREFRKQKSLLEIYKSDFSKYLVVNEIQKMKPEAFDALEADYQSQLATFQHANKS